MFFNSFKERAGMGVWVWVWGGICKVLFISVLGVLAVLGACAKLLF